MDVLNLLFLKFQVSPIVIAGILNFPCFSAQHMQHRASLDKPGTYGKLAKPNVIPISDSRFDIFWSQSTPWSDEEWDPARFSWSEFHTIYAYVKVKERRPVFTFHVNVVDYEVDRFVQQWMRSLHESVEKHHLLLLDHYERISSALDKLQWNIWKFDSYLSKSVSVITIRAVVRLLTGS